MHICVYMHARVCTQWRVGKRSSARDNIGPDKGASACSPKGRSVAVQRKRFRNTEHGGAHVRDGAGSVRVVNEFLNETRRFARARKRKIVETSQIKISALRSLLRGKYSKKWVTESTAVKLQNFYPRRSNNVSYLLASRQLEIIFFCATNDFGRAYISEDTNSW